MPHVDMKGKKSLTPDERKHATAWVVDKIQRDFGGVESRAAKAWKISRSNLYTFTRGGIGGGIRSLSDIARYYQAAIGEILGHEQAAEVIRVYADERHPNRGLAVAMARVIGYHPEAIQRVEDADGETISRVNGRGVLCSKAYGDPRLEAPVVTVPSVGELGYSP